jgi:uncharacterized membrane protein
MNKVIFVGFDTEQQARTGEHVLHQLHTEGPVTLHNVAIVVREASGKVAVRERPKMRPMRTAGGVILGGLIGLLGGPVGTAVGMGAGAVTGALFDLTRAGVGDAFVKQVGAHLEPGKAALIADIDEDSEGPLDRRMEAIGGTLLRRTRKEIHHVYFEQVAEPSEEELARLEAEQLADVRASQDEAARKETDRLQAKIDATRRKMREKEEELEAQLQLVKDEGHEKIALLEAQKAAATAESQALLERRVNARGGIES